MKHRSPHIHFPAGGKRLRVCLLALCDIACVSGIFLLTGYVHSRWAGSVCDFGAVCRETLPFLFLFLIYNALFRVYHGSFFYPGICLNKIEEIRRISLSRFQCLFPAFHLPLFLRAEGTPAVECPVFQHGIYDSSAPCLPFSCAFPDAAVEFRAD